MPLRARELDDVVHGEEERLVLRLGDDRELVLDQLAHLVVLVRRRGRDGQATGEPFLGQAAQIAGRGLAGGNDLLGILVAQHLERELAARGDDERLGEPCGRIDAAQRLDRSQVTLAVRVQRVAGFGNGGLEADRGQRVLQRAALALVHVHVACGDDGETEDRGDGDELFAARRVVGVEQALGGDP